VTNLNYFILANPWWLWWIYPWLPI